MVQIPDKYRLPLLGISLTACALTYFIPNASHNLTSIKNISPPIDRYCNSIKIKFRNDCKKKDETSVQCIDLRDDLQDCQDAIISAYKQVNMKCLGQSVQVQSCALDCEGESSEDSNEGSGSEEDCNKICREKADRLADCERNFVRKQLKAYGIQDIVSMG